MHNNRLELLPFSKPFRRWQDTPNTLIRAQAEDRFDDDTDMVRSVVVAILEAGRFHILQANTGTSAVKPVADYAGKVILLLSDVKMLEMSGPESGDTLKRARPDIHVMFLSGFGGGDLLVLNYRGALIDRPFVPEELVEMANVVLHSRNRSQGDHRFDTHKATGTGEEGIPAVLTPF